MASQQELYEEFEHLFDTRPLVRPEIVTEWLSNHPGKNVNNIVDDTGYNILMHAIERNDTSLIRALLTSYRANVNYALMLAAELNDIPLVDTLLTTYGAKIDNTINRAGYNPLMIAIQNNNIPLINMLLDRGADINYHSPRRYNQTPLIVAVLEYINLVVKEHYWHKHMKFPTPYVIRLLINKGANIDEVDSNNLTALDHAKIQELPNIVQLLTNRQAAGGRKGKTHRKMQRKRRRRHTRKMKYRK